MTDIQIVKQSGEKMIVTNGSKFAVVYWNAQTGQVQANGYFAAGKSDAAVNYVAKWVAQSTAEKQFRAS